MEELDDRIRRWRLILGRAADPKGSVPLDGPARGMDDALEALYDSDREGGLGASSPNVNRWLGDIREYFPSPVVQLLQRDALDRLGLRQMLLEPELLEAIVPDVELIGALLTLRPLLPEPTRATARQLVQRIAADIERRLREPLREAVQGSLHRAERNRRPRFNEIDWSRTIRANLRHYQPDYQTIIPEHLHGYGRRGPKLRHLILLVDQSASMAASVVYAAVIGSVLASLRSVRTDLVVFDTSVVDLTSELDDPVDLLFATHLGGGTDIARAMAYARGLIRTPADTILFLISDLYEGGRVEHLIEHAAAIRSAGAQLISLLALNDQGAPAYDKAIAAHFAALDIPAFACTPDQFPPLLAAALQRKDIRQWLGQMGMGVKN